VKPYSEEAFSSCMLLKAGFFPILRSIKKCIKNFVGFAESHIFARAIE
jgi:hypothetical protein